MSQQRITKIAVVLLTCLVLAIPLTSCEFAYTDFKMRHSPKTGCAEAIVSIDGEDLQDGYVYGAINQACESLGEDKIDKDVYVSFQDGIPCGRGRRACVVPSPDGFFIRISKQSQTKYSHLHHEAIHVLLIERGVPVYRHHRKMRQLGVCDNLQKDGWYTHCGGF